MDWYDKFCKAKGKANSQLYYLDELARSFHITGNSKVARELHDITDRIGDGIDGMDEAANDLILERSRAARKDLLETTTECSERS